MDICLFYMDVSTMMESCLNDRVARAETIQVEDLRRDLCFDLCEIAEAQVSSPARLTCAHLELFARRCSCVMWRFICICLCAGLQLLRPRVFTGVPPDKAVLTG